MKRYPRAVLRHGLIFVLPNSIDYEYILFFRLEYLKPIWLFFCWKNWSLNWSPNGCRLFQKSDLYRRVIKDGVKRYSSTVSKSVCVSTWYQNNIFRWIFCSIISFLGTNISIHRMYRFNGKHWLTHGSLIVLCKRELSWNIVTVWLRWRSGTADIECVFFLVNTIPT